MDIVVCKCVAVGDESTGKTSLLMVHATGEFPKEHLATVFENYDNVIKGTDRTIRLTLWDTSGQEVHSLYI
jgi:GTPase SAR1 family protein